MKKIVLLALLITLNMFGADPSRYKIYDIPASRPIQIKEAALKARLKAVDEIEKDYDAAVQEYGKLVKNLKPFDNISHQIKIIELRQQINFLAALYFYAKYAECERASTSAMSFLDSE